MVANYRQEEKWFFSLSFAWDDEFVARITRCDK